VSKFFSIDYLEGEMVIIALVNLLVGGNYLFICHKPATPSLIDALGPWAW